MCVRVRVRERWVVGGNVTAGKIMTTGSFMLHLSDILGEHITVAEKTHKRENVFTKTLKFND